MVYFFYVTYVAFNAGSKVIFADNARCLQVIYCIIKVLREADVDNKHALKMVSVDLGGPHTYTLPLLCISLL